MKNTINAHGKYAGIWVLTENDFLNPHNTPAFPSTSRDCGIADHMRP